MDTDPNRQEVPPTTRTEPYSGTNPIPKVQDYYEEVLARSKREGEVAQHAAAAEPSKSHEKVDNEHRQGGENKTRRKVFDPVTGSDEVVIEDMEKNKHNKKKKKVGFEREEIVTVPVANVVGNSVDQQNTYPPAFPNNNHAPSEAQDPAEGHTKSGGGTVKTTSHQHPEEYSKAQDITAPPDPLAPHSTTDVPIHGDKTNLLFHPTPTLSLSSTTVIVELEKRAIITCLTAIVLISFLPFFLPGSMAPQFRWATALGLFLTGIGVAGGLWFWMKRVIEQARNVDWASEKQRGEIGGQNLVPESVEWLNRLVGVAWKLVNPEMFASLADMIEDVMQASVPAVIENVRIADISQGSTALRILSLRSLPDKHVKSLKSGDGKHAKDSEQGKAEEQGGEWYNIEASIAYHADPSGKGVSTKAKNMHLLVVFYVGIRGLFGVPIPIWVELKGLVATARMRLQLTPDPPFLKTLTFTLMGAPQISVSCVPMTEKGINVLDLPLISGFVDASITTVANEYVAPKSMSLDLAKMLEGDDVKKDTETIGVLVVKVHKAVGLSRQDRSGGGCDSYVTLGFSKYGKPMYSTRVIVGDLNPIWEETAFVLVHPNHIKARENLSVELWDSDRFTSDDMVGKTEVPLETLIQNAGKMHHQVTTDLGGLEHDSSMPGKLEWSVGFFGKAPFRPALRTTGEDVRLAPELQDLPELQDAVGSLDSKIEDAVMHTPPDPLWPNGILSVIIHQIVGLEVQHRNGTYGKKKGGKEFSPGQETGEIKEEEGGNLPSCYCTISLNDQLIYRTRTKAVTSKPIFNAGTERFIRDWRSSIITICARDSRTREHDPILGVVPIKLTDILQTTSQVTRWFPLDAGIGFGRVRVSILFRSTQTTIPPALQGWDVGTWEFTSDYVVAEGYNQLGKIKLRTGGSIGSLSASSASKYGPEDGPGGGIRWDVRRKGRKTSKLGAAEDPSIKLRRLKLPVKHRYMSPIVFDIYDTSIVNSVKNLKRKPVAHAILWLQNVIDNEISEIDIPIFTTSDSRRLCQNYILSPSDDAGIDLKEVGRLKFQGCFRAGMDREHKRFIMDNDSRETYETWEACRGEGIRGDNDGHVRVGRVIEGLHERSIAQMREDLIKTEKGEFAENAPTGQTVKMVSQEEKKRLTDKYGVDWSEVYQMAIEQIMQKSILKSLPEEGACRKNLTNTSSNENTSTSQDGQRDRERRDSAYGEDSWHYLRNYDYNQNSRRTSASEADRYTGGYDQGDDSYGSDSDSDDSSTYSSTSSAPTSPTGSYHQSSAVKPIPPPSAPSTLPKGEEESSKNLIKSLKQYRANQRNLHRHHQGLMQWKPMRGFAFAKDEVKFGVRKVKNKVALKGREPDVETEV